MDIRYLQASKEAKISLLLTVLYLVVWLITAYTFGDSIGILGFPLWFESACVFLPIGFILVCWLAVRYQFKDISLESPTDPQ